MVNMIVNNINAGFGNCIFINKDAKSVARTILMKMNDANEYYPKVPKRIDLVPFDDMHDKMILDYSDNGTDLLTGTVTWGKSANGLHYIFKEFNEG